jgi:polyhydroxyalkanoate synthesis regulator phasin
MSEFSVSLINGTFSSEEGEKVIRDVIASKIAFHQKKRLSTLIKQQTADDFSDKRIRELTQEIEVLTQQLSSLSSNSELIIRCDIKVQVISKEE